MNDRVHVPLVDREASGLTRDRLRLELRRSSRPFLIVLAATLVALGCAAILLRNLDVSWPFADSYDFQVAVDDAKGIVPGQQEVRLAGVPVGRIDAVDLVDGRPVLRVHIDSRYAPLHQDARLRVRPQTPLQDLYLTIESRGSHSASPLAEGATLSAERTITPVDISRVFNVFDPPTRDRFEHMIDGFARGLDDEGDQFRATFVELVPFIRSAARLSRATAIRRKATRRLVHNFRLIVDELSRRDQQVSGLVAGGSTTLAALRQTSAPLDRTLVELPPTLVQLRETMRTLDTSLGELDPALEAFRPTAAALEPALRALEDLSAQAQPAFASLRRVTARLTPLAREASPLARDLAPTFKRLRSSAPKLNRITRVLVPCMYPVQKFFQWSASVGKFSDANAVYPRGEGVSYSPSDPPDPAPSCAPGKVGG